VTVRTGDRALREPQGALSLSKGGLRIGRGSVYVAIVIAALATYFVYQTWFNPSRAVKRRLGEIAGVLSSPESEPDIERLGRLARLRRYLANDVHVRVNGADIDGSGTIVGMLASARAPKGGIDIQCVDVQVSVESETTAHAGLMLEVNTLDERTGEWVSDRYETIADLLRRDGEWIVVKGEIKNQPPR
jgi:hypothetical protein